MPKLGINIDHVATLRQARLGFEPDPITAANICQKAGAHSIVCYLREDRRHIQDADLPKLRRTVKNLSLELSLADDIISIACRLKPDTAVFVPERRAELTTEGGLDVIKYFAQIKKACAKLKEKNIKISLFTAPVQKQIEAAWKLRVEMIELHTGSYAHAKSASAKRNELNKLKHMAEFAHNKGLIVNAGHGLNYNNTRDVAQIKYIHELNIGQDRK